MTSALAPLLLLLAFAAGSPQNSAPKRQPAQDPRPMRPATRTVILETPGVTCTGRFQDSLRQKIAARHDWMHSVALKRLASVDPFHDGREPPRSSDPALAIGHTLWVFFEVDAEVSDEQVVKTVAGSGYYVTKGWKLVVRRAIPRD